MDQSRNFGDNLRSWDTEQSLNDIRKFLSYDNTILLTQKGNFKISFFPHFISSFSFIKCILIMCTPPPVTPRSNLTSLPTQLSILKKIFQLVLHIYSWMWAFNGRSSTHQELHTLKKWTLLSQVEDFVFNSILQDGILFGLIL